jgi:hypothetical protein
MGCSGAEIPKNGSVCRFGAFPLVNLILTAVAQPNPLVLQYSAMLFITIYQCAELRNCRIALCRARRCLAWLLSLCHKRSISRWSLWRPEMASTTLRMRAAGATRGIMTPTNPHNFGKLLVSLGGVTCPGQALFIRSVILANSQKKGQQRSAISANNGYHSPR